MSKWRSSIFKFDFDNEEFAPISFHDKVEKQKLKEFEQEMFLKDWPDRHAWIAECAYYKSERRGGLQAWNSMIRWWRKRNL